MLLVFDPPRLAEGHCDGPSRSIRILQGAENCIPTRYRRPVRGGGTVGPCSLFLAPSFREDMLALWTSSLSSPGYLLSGIIISELEGGTILILQIL